MAKVVKHVYQTEDSGSGMLMAVVLLIIFFFVFWYWGLPLVRNVQQEGINIQVPDKIQIDVNQTAPQSPPTNTY